MSNKRRRTKGTGSVYTRKDGRVVGEYEVNGRTRYIYGRDEKQVADRVAEAIRDRDAGIDSENMTVGGYLDRWLTAIRDTVRVGTCKQYEMIVRLHIKPTLGTVKLDKLNALQIQSFYRERLDAGLSSRRVQYVHVTLRKALNQETRLDHMLEDHVMSNMSFIRSTKLKSSGSRAGSDHDRAATEVPTSRKETNRVFCGDGVDAAVEYGDYRFGVGHPSVVLEYDPLSGDAHEPRAAF